PPRSFFQIYKRYSMRRHNLLKACSKPRGLPALVRTATDSPRASTWNDLAPENQELVRQHLKSVSDRLVREEMVAALRRWISLSKAERCEILGIRMDEAEPDFTHMIPPRQDPPLGGRQ